MDEKEIRIRALELAIGLSSQYEKPELIISKAKLFNQFLETGNYDLKENNKEFANS
jgi:hypothetical protein